MRGGFEGATAARWPPFAVSSRHSPGTYTFLVIYVLTGTGGQIFAAYRFPLSGGVTMRHGVKKSKSVGSFKRRVGVTEKVNLQRNRRGGIRL